MYSFFFYGFLVIGFFDFFLLSGFSLLFLLRIFFLFGLVVCFVRGFGLKVVFGRVLFNFRF